MARYASAVRATDMFSQWEKRLQSNPAKFTGAAQLANPLGLRWFASPLGKLRQAALSKLDNEVGWHEECRFTSLRL